MKNISKLIILIVTLMSISLSMFGEAKILWGTTNQINTWSDKSGYTSISGNLYTAKVTGLTVGTKYYIAASMTDTYTGVYTSANTACTYSVTSGVQAGDDKIGSQNYNVGDYRYQFIYLYPSVTDLIVTYNSSTHMYTITSDSEEKFSVTPSITGGTVNPSTAQSVVKNGSVTFTVTPTDGYGYESSSLTPSTAGTLSRNGNVFTVSDVTAACTFSATYSQQYVNVQTSVTQVSEQGSISPTSAHLTIGSDQDFTVTCPDDYIIDATNTKYSGQAEISISGNTISLNNITEDGTLTVKFVEDENATPVVYWASYPVMGVNTISLSGYLAERYCKQIKGSGFFWSLSDDITVAKITTAIGGGEGSDKLIAATVAPTGNGSLFTTLNSNALASLTDVTTIYLVNYVKTCGGVGISDRVSVNYTPCNGIQYLTLSPTTVQLPEGKSVQFEAIARSAGKHPEYKWYKDGVDDEIAAGTEEAISGATSDTYTFTMSDETTHTIKVKVTDDCGSSMYTPATATSTASSGATVSLCDGGTSVVLSAAKLSTTPWVGIALTAALTNVNTETYEWSVSPSSGEVNAQTSTGATFKGKVLSGEKTVYTITYKAKSSCAGTDIEVTDSIEITVNKDEESCSGE